MTRRESIKNILIASSATVFLTGCSEADVVEFFSEGHLLLNDKHEDYLGKIASTFLPLGDLAERVGSPVSFIMTMINDCHSPEDIQNFALGFDQYKLLMKESRLKVGTDDINEALSVIKDALETKEPAEEMTFFINTTKNLAVKHLMTSEYYMTEYLDYKLIPERFEGCIDV